VAASVESQNQVIVSWYKNPEPDIVGYHVYRARGGSIYSSISGYQKLTSSPVNGTSFTDNVDLSDGVARGYVVSAVNTFGLESAYSPAATTFPGTCNWAWAFPMGANFALRWQPPERTKITGVNLYRCSHPPEHMNGSTLITDTVSMWPMPPNTGGTGYELMGKTYVVRALNVLNQEGFMTDQISPVNTDYGFGIVPVTMRFKYSDYYADYNPGAIEDSQSVTGDLAEGDIAIWPNPSNPTVNISFQVDNSQRVKIEALDVGGRMLISRTVYKSAGNHVEQLDFNHLASGIYIVTVKVNGKRFQKRVICIR
jgi:hypothetical protein